MAASTTLIATLILLATIHQTQSILQTAAIDILLPAASSPITLLASQASFGSPLAPYSQRHDHKLPTVSIAPSFPPQQDPYLCNESDNVADYSNYVSNAKTNGGQSKYDNLVLLVPRGQCSFERKALSAQRLGASAIIIYGTLSSRYSLNYTNSTEDCAEDSCHDAKTRDDGYYTQKDVLWPANKYDYDCDMGRASIPSGEMTKLDFVHLPGGYNEENDGYLVGTGENNLCVKYNVGTGKESFLGRCASERCLVTGKNTTLDDGNINFEACCAWDLHVWLYADSSIPKEVETVTIPAVYITMEQSAELLDMVRGVADSSVSNGGEPLVLSMYSRYVPKYNFSAVLIWAFGVFVAWVASYRSSVEYRKVGKAVMMRRKLIEEERNSDGGYRDDTDAASNAGSVSNSWSRTPPNSRAVEIGRSSSKVSTENNDPTVTNEQSEERIIYRAESNAPNAEPNEDPESLELTASHALGFIVMASTALLVLFFFKIFAVVKVMYAFGCSGAFAQTIVHPGLTYLCKRLKWESPMKPVSWLTEEGATRAALRGGFKGHCLMCLWSFVGPFTPVDVSAMVISYGVGATWLYVAFMFPHPDSYAFYWVIQDIFGLCMCVLFLSTIKLNAIRVAAILLTVAFFYDIFFVFVTPLLTKHGESIMVNVATSGGPPKADPSWCEKYPFDSECKGGDPLPMLFAIPRIGDYQGGCSMLGLGDIVLPGLLLSFASRYDEAKRLIGVIGGGSGRMRNNACPDATQQQKLSPLCFLCCCCRQGYFGPVMVAYAIGLAMANAAVYIMQMGQPALLYLVPCCLGTMVYIGHKSGELNDLWEGPRVIRAADALLYGAPRVESGAEQEGSEIDGNGDQMQNEEEAELT